jgi:hypothetical protein
MQARKSAAHVPHFDTFECLTCQTTIVEQPANEGAFSVVHAAGGADPQKAGHQK